ncbi:MAG TPA: SMC-Scp complex subunit ScpB [Methylomirabilota bacterium]|nr:SMC-Scp complex subunit ScpB [Methylomirabilota bacterium]
MTDDDRFQQLRVLEAMIFASAEPVPEAGLAARLPEGTNLPDLLQELTTLYANRGVNLVHLDDKWAFRTAPDLGPRLQIEQRVTRKLSRAALETLAVIAYHQPVTRAEVEEVRGVALSKGTLDTLLEIGWVRPKGRRRTPGRPVTWVTTTDFLDHFGLESLEALPGVEELKAAGLLDVRSAISSLGAQALADTARPANHDGTDSDQADEDEGEVATADELDEAALVAALGELPEED